MVRADTAQARAIAGATEGTAVARAAKANENCSMARVEATPCVVALAHRIAGIGYQTSRLPTATHA